jgi:hypothetical protein
MQKYAFQDAKFMTAHEKELTLKAPIPLQLMRCSRNMASSLRVKAPAGHASGTCQRTQRQR